MRIILALALGGCVTTSNAGRYVTDLRFNGNALVVDRCEMQQTTTNWAALLLLPPMWLLCSAGCSGDWKSYETTAEACTTEVHPLPGAQQ